MTDQSPARAGAPDWRRHNANFWQEVSAFYVDRGIDAWDKLVPNEVTNNPDFSARCALGVMQYFIDCRANGYTGDFVIIEPGGGIGKFCYLFLKQLQALMKTVDFDQSSVTYWLCDQSEQQQTFWREHPQLKPLIDQKILKTERFCIRYEDGLAHIDSSFDTATLRDKRVVMLTNYFLDSLFQQPYLLHDGAYIPQTIHLRRSITPEKNRLKFQSATGDDYTRDEAINHIMREFQENGIERILMPEVAMELIQWLDQCTDHPLLVICHDKGYSDLTVDGYDALYNIVWTGQYAACVNFDALAKYVNSKLGGRSVLAAPRDNYFCCAVFHTKCKNDTLPGFSITFEESVRSGISLTRMYTHQNFVRYELEKLQDVVALFREVRYTPRALVSSKTHFIDLLNKTEDFDDLDINHTLDCFLGHYYFTPHTQSQDELVALIEVGQAAKAYCFVEDVLSHYADWHGEDYHFKRLSGCLYFLQSDFSSAAYYFTEALNDNPECETSHEYLAHCESLL